MEFPPSSPHLPISGIFAIEKPCGITAMSHLARLKPLFSSSRLFSQPNEDHRWPSPSSSSPEARKHFNKQHEDFMLEMSYDWRDRRSSAKSQGVHMMEWKEVNDRFVKMGTGGSLDSLANGVLIVGINEGRHNLSHFIESDKVYRITALLGCETDSGDSKGNVSRFAPWAHVMERDIQHCLGAFNGVIWQKTSIYPAFKVGGLTLAQYANLDKPLPEPILSRKYTISHLSLLSFAPYPHHSYIYPESRLTKDQLRERRKIFELVAQSEEGGPPQNHYRGYRDKGMPRSDRSAFPPKRVGQADAAVSWRRNAPMTSIAPLLSHDGVRHNETDDDLQPSPGHPPVFEIQVTVSSGTNIRTLINDIAKSVQSAAHVVALTRVGQTPFYLEKTTTLPSVSTLEPITDNQNGSSEKQGLTSRTHLEFPCLPARVLEEALMIRDQDGNFTRDKDGWAEWERAILEIWPDQSRLMANLSSSLKRRW
ncbi:hypothetical protein FRB91_003047 [Serendipita sp. 411]|nr:hypothetical protein FRC19_007580 [Serendipita sp. 401]KAG8843848.1 hypothetical protein FRB91_003047 [Serendipita sp. 411]KAG9058316.1 hypothetical protein FS842_010686 [Serendipita sp. 407]